MRTVTLKAGDTEFQATFREPQDILTKHRLLVEAAMMTAGPAIAKMPPDNLTAAQQEAWREAHPMSMKDNLALLELYKATIIATLASWTLPRPLPTYENIEELPNDIYEALRAATQEQGVADTQAISGTDFSVNPDVDSPTNGSGDSNGLSKAGAENLSIEPTTPATESTVIESSTL